MASNERTTSFVTNWHRKLWRWTFQKVPAHILPRGSEGNISRRVWEPYEDSIGTSGTLRIGGDKNAEGERNVWSFLEQELRKDPARAEKFRMLMQFLGSDGKVGKHTFKIMCDLDNAWDSTNAGLGIHNLRPPQNIQPASPRLIRGRLGGRRGLCTLPTGDHTYVEGLRRAALTAPDGPAGDAARMRWDGMLDAVMNALEESARLQHRQGGVSYDQVMGDWNKRNALRQRAGLPPEVGQRRGPGNGPQQRLPGPQGPGQGPGNAPPRPGEFPQSDQENEGIGLFLSSGKSSTGFEKADGPLVFLPGENHIDDGQGIEITGTGPRARLGKTTIDLARLPVDVQSVLIEGFERRIPVRIASDGMSAALVEDEGARKHWGRYNKAFLPFSEQEKSSETKSPSSNPLEEDAEFDDTLKDEYSKCVDGIVTECKGMTDWTELHRTLYTIKDDKLRSTFIEKLDNEQMNDLAENIFDDLRNDLQGVGNDNVKLRDTLHANLKSQKLLEPSFDQEDYRAAQKMGSDDTRTKITEEVQNRLIGAAGGVFWHDAISGADGVAANNKALNGAVWRPGNNNSPLFHAYQRVLKEEYANPQNHPVNPGLGANAQQQYAGLNAMMAVWNGVNGGGGIPAVVNNNAAGGMLVGAAAAAAGNMATIANATDFDRALVRLHRTLHPDKAWFPGAAAANPAARGAALVQPLDAATMEQVKKDLQTVKTQLPAIPQALRDQIAELEQVASLTASCEKMRGCNTPETARDAFKGFKGNNVQWKTLLESMTPLAPPPNYTVEPEHAHLIRKIPSNIKENVKNGVANGASPLGNAALQAAGHGANAFAQQLANGDTQYMKDILGRTASGHCKAEIMIKSAGVPKHKTREDLGEGVRTYLDAMDRFAGKAIKRIPTLEPITRS